MKNYICIKSALAILVMASTAHADTLTLFTDDAVVTGTTFGGNEALSFKYTGSISMPNDTDTSIVIPQWIGRAGYSDSLAEVRVTVRAIISGANVQMDNDSEGLQTGTARVQNLVNSYTGPVTPNAGFATIIEAADMQVNESQIFNLGATSGDTVGGFNVTSESDYGNWSPGTLEAGDGGTVGSFAYADTYTGTGSLTFTINSTFTTSATFSGENGFFQGNTPTGGFFTEVEYIVIPEVGTLAMMGIAFGSLGAVALFRRRKRV